MCPIEWCNHNKRTKVSEFAAKRRNGEGTKRQKGRHGQKNQNTREKRQQDDEGSNEKISTQKYDRQSN
jgi:hypothetical protein